ncbi:hypothetical protein [Myxococcus eversor]|uniref:hypothetical protein n=1 Tax=Myxococcus eversor TaxID=2709661 RepID=UPI0013D84F71|nr:hypothetical protein [Myxococcus eversor]
MSPAGRWGVTLAGVVLSLSLAAYLRTALRPPEYRGPAGPPRPSVGQGSPRIVKKQQPQAPTVPPEPSESPVSTPAKPGRVQVQATRGWNGYPLRGVAVGIMVETKPRVVIPEQPRTDEHGMAYFPNVPSGRLTICARGVGYLESCRTAELQADGNLSMVLGLTEDETARAPVATP